MSERWVAVAEVAGYEVSDLGRVRSTDREICVMGAWGKMVTKKLRSRVLKDYRSGAGYRMVMLGLGGPRRYVHRLVADAFLKDDGKAYINHIDGDKNNNRLDNIERATPSENAWHSAHVLGNRRGQFVAGRNRHH